MFDFRMFVFTVSTTGLHNFFPVSQFLMALIFNFDRFFNALTHSLMHEYLQGL